MKLDTAVSKSVLLILTSILIAVAGQVMLKWGANDLERIGQEALAQPLNTLFTIMTSPKILVGFFLYATSAIIWIIVLSRVDLSFAYPFLGSSFIFMLLVTKYIFNEAIPPWRWVGTIIICLGIIISGRV